MVLVPETPTPRGRQRHEGAADLLDAVQAGNVPVQDPTDGVLRQLGVPSTTAATYAMTVGGFPQETRFLVVGSGARGRPGDA